jgi:hypothetical protein
MELRTWMATSAALALASLASAQGYRDLEGPSYRELQITRNRPRPYVSGLIVRGGLGGVMADDEDQSVGREESMFADGFAYFRADRVTAYEFGLEAYAGRDGAVLSMQQDNMGEDGASGGRLELSARYFPFYREGYYDGDDWVATGRYEGRDEGAYLGFTSVLGEGVILELGPFYRQYQFERTDATDVGYTIPEDYNTYGGRIYFEQSTLQLDNLYGLPKNGFQASIRVDYEQNDAEGDFGTVRWSSSLPSTIWRGALRLEWYFPTDGASVWEFRLDGEMNDRADRVHIYDAQKPIGETWADARLGYRLELGSGLFVTPFAQLQYTKTPNASGDSASDDFWIGAGGRFRFDLGDAMSVLGEYSYLSNANRPSSSYEEDVYGEHQFFVGAELRIGASRY